MDRRVGRTPVTLTALEGAIGDVENWNHLERCSLRRENVF